MFWLSGPVGRSRTTVPIGTPASFPVPSTVATA